MPARLTRRSFAGALGALGLPAAGAPRACRAAEATTMRLSVADAATNPFGIAGLHFAAAVNRRAKGQLTIEVYPNGQLVSQSGTADALASGVLDFAIQSSAVFATLVPQLQVLDTPFMFKDYATIYRVLDGPIGAELGAALEAKGISVLTWGIGGFKELSTTTRRIAVPDDMKGLRIRVQNAAVFVATYQALGAIPVTIDVNEMYLALSQHTVDAIDVNLNAVTTGKFYTLIKHVAMSNHIVAAEPLYGSKRKIEALSPALQKIVREEGKALAPFWRSYTERQTAADIQTLKNNGVAFNEIQYAAFRKAMDPVYAGVQARLGGDLLDRVRRAAGG